MILASLRFWRAEESLGRYTCRGYTHEGACNPETACGNVWRGPSAMGHAGFNGTNVGGDHLARRCGRHLRIARFLNRIVFCFFAVFAEDTGLLPPGLSSDVLKSGINDPAHLARTLETLFAAMTGDATA